MRNGQAPAIAADQNRHNQRPARQAELDRRGNARQRHGNAAKQHAEHNAQKQLGNMRNIQLALGVAENRHTRFDMRLIADHGNRIAKLQTGIVIGDKLHAGAAHAGDIHAVTPVDIEAGQFAVANRVLRHIDAHRGNALRHRGMTGFIEHAAAGARTDERGKLLETIVAGDNQQRIAMMQHHILIGEHGNTVLMDTRHRKRHIQGFIQLCKRLALEQRIFHLERRAGNTRHPCPLAAQRQALFGVHIDTESEFEEKQRGNQPHDAARISRRVGCRHLHRLRRLLRHRPERLLRRAQTGRIGHRALHNTDQLRQRRLGKRQKSKHNHNIQGNHQQHQTIKPQALALKRSEKTRPNLQADTIDKQNQPEFLDKMGNMRIDRQTEKRRENAGKQHHRHPETDTQKTQTPERRPAANHQRINQCGISGTIGIGQKIAKPLHKENRCRKSGIL